MHVHLFYTIYFIGFYRGLIVVHIEAGLRTYQLYSPFPEEFNRKTISSIATFHFAPTENNKRQLLQEGVSGSKIFVTGNTVIDAVKYIMTNNKTKHPASLGSQLPVNHTIILITLHRRENIAVMPQLYHGISDVDCPKCIYIIPLHPNPEAKQAAHGICDRYPFQFWCIPPLSYEELHWLLSQCYAILTDSGQ